MHQEIDHGMAYTQQTPVLCYECPRQREPTFFNGNDYTDSDYSLSAYERGSAHNRWYDGLKLNNVEFLPYRGHLHTG